MRRLVEDKKGISPVITTVIIVAVGIAVAIAVALWMSGLVATFTRVEKLEVTGTYAIVPAAGTSWEVHITVKNTGAADATITSIMINGIPVSDPSATGVTSADVVVGSTTYDMKTPGTSAPVSVGDSAAITIKLTKSIPPATIGSTKLTSGITLNIVIHTAAGRDYPTSVVLP